MTSPSVELHFNPTDLRPRDLPSPGAFLSSPAEALEAALAMVRARMVAQMKAEARGLVEPTYGQLLRLADMTWQLFLPQYRKVSAPVIADAYVRAWSRVEAGDVPMSIIYDLAEKHAEKVGDYFHASSRDALAEGFNTMVNRRIPAKAAADKVLDAYGLTPRQMRGYANNKQLVTSVDSPVSLDVKARSRDYIDKSFTGRVRKLAEQEEHNIEEQAKQFAWMWLQDKGRLNERAQKMWITAHDERVCPVCGPLHGQKVLVNEQFKTHEGNFWSPGIHPNCRCVVRLIENKFQLEKRFDPHQPRGNNGRWAGGQSQSRQLGHKVNALASPSAKVIQGVTIHRTAQAVGYLKEPRYLVTPLKHRDKEMARLAHGAAAWSRRSAHVQRAREMADPDNEYYASKMRLSQTEKSLKSLISAVESAPANSPELHRGMVVSPEHLDELKPGSTFQLPMSSFTESRDFSEHFARKWGPMIASAHAKREGKEVTGVHPVVMVLEPKANALNISPLVAERQAEWITRGEFLITQVGDDDGLTVVHLKQTSNRISKADWEPKEHPRGGDPENRGRFSRVAEKERPKAAIWSQLATAEVEPEVKPVEKEPVFDMDPGTFDTAPLRRSKTFDTTEAFDVPSEVFDVAAEAFDTPEPAFDMPGPLTAYDTAASPMVDFHRFPEQPKGKPDLAPLDKTFLLAKDASPYYTVIHESDYDTDMTLDQKVFTNSETEVASMASEKREALIDEILDRVVGAHRDKPFMVTGYDNQTGEELYGQISASDYETSLREVARQAQRDYDYDELEVSDNYMDVEWYTGNNSPAGEDAAYISMTEIVNQSGVQAQEFVFRILKTTSGIRDENMTRALGRNKYHLSGQYVESGPHSVMADNDGKEIMVTPIKPYV